MPVYSLPGFYEPFSVISHLLGAAAFAALGFMLLRRGRGDAGRMTFLGIYVGSCVLLFSMSGVFHMVTPGGAAYRTLERLDHSAIFLLIAGSFTPAHGILLHGWLRWGPLLTIWTLALGALTLKAIYFDSLPPWLSLSCYLGLGWLGVVSATLVARRHGIAFIRPLVWGGLAYTLGAIVYFIDWPNLIPGVLNAHELFHIAVLAGACFHWRFIWQFADGQVHQPRRAIQPS